MPDQTTAAPDRQRHLRAMRLSLAATDPTAGAMLDAARHALATTLATAPDSLSATTIHTALAALALGNDQAAAQAIHLCAARQATNGSIPGIHPGDAAPAGTPDLTHLYLLLLARYLAWTGGIHTLRGQWSGALLALEHRPGDPRHPAASGWTTALAELALAAESIGDKTTAARIRAELPEPTELADAAHPGPPRVRPDPRSAAAEPVDYYLYGILGIEPDAPQNRLVLRPRLPDDWDRLQLTGLRFGDAEITLRYQRLGSRHHFTIDQESGAVPVRVIFEPEIPERRLVRAVVDGQDATLDPRPADGRLRVPIQIVLDTTRKVELEGGEGKTRGRVLLPVR